MPYNDEASAAFWHFENRGGGFYSRLNKALQRAGDKAEPGRMNFSSLSQERRGVPSLSASRRRKKARLRRAEAAASVSESNKTLQEATLSCRALKTHTDCRHCRRSAASETISHA